MDLTQLANIGEFIGGVAVLVTLVYLTVQVRQTKEMTKMESARSSSKDWSELLLRLVDPDLMQLLRRGFNDFESMEPNDQARLHVFLTATLMASQATFTQSKLGVSEEAMTETIESWNAALIRSKGIAGWWAEARAVFPEDFVRYVEQAATAQKDAPLIPESLSWYRWSGTEERSARS